MVFFSFFLTFLLLYKYAALFVIAFVAALILPIPASTTLAAAGAFSSQGYLDLGTVLIVAFMANVAGDIAGYLLARRYGEAVLYKIGFRRVLESSRYRALREYFLSSQWSLIYFSRFLTQIGPAVNLLSGLVKVPYKIFFLFDVLGEASYVLLYALAGYFLGSQWENNVDFFIKAALVMLSLGLTVTLIQAGIYRRKTRH